MTCDSFLIITRSNGSTPRLDPRLDDGEIKGIKLTLNNRIMTF